MTLALEFIATLACLLFTGAAVYITVVEHPARMRCRTECAWSQWAPSYRRATVMQASLAVVATLAGVATWLISAGIGWLVGAALIFTVIPTTLLVIRPTNTKLLAPGRDPAAESTRNLLVRWGQLHAIRTLMSLGASTLFLIEVCRG